MPTYLLIDWETQQHPSMKIVMGELCRMSIFCAQELGFSKEAVQVDSASLYCALSRYLRDIFGYQRITDSISSRLESFASTCSTERRGELLKIQDAILADLRDCGIRISSDNPYVHKRAAFLLYHLTIAKPFYVKSPINTEVGEKVAYFNAYSSMFIVNAALATANLTLNVSIDLIRDLTYHNLTRSSLEAVLRTAKKR
ncbi:MAG: hypothetical protein LBV04_09600 [Deferribacteraceae bacterium]|jgi:hypothetical protein|nr:hypothetical protein [Deferribacteraceae bacterium]